MKNRQLVYLVECNGLYKIGISADINKRILGLQTASPHPIKCIAYYKTVNDARNVEAALHKVFAKYRMIGEWFDFEGKFTQEAFDSLCPKYGMEPLAFLEDGSCMIIPEVETKKVKKLKAFGDIPNTTGGYTHSADSIAYWRKRYGIKTKGK